MMLPCSMVANGIERKPLVEITLDPPEARGVAHEKQAEEKKEEDLSLLRKELGIQEVRCNHTPSCS